jgi:alkylation response protein AidB-like acyl-CoA dehydrogenase
MDFEYDDEERVRARELGEAVVAGSVIERDRAAGWDPSLFRALGRAGVFETRNASVATERLIGLGEGSRDAGLALAATLHLIGCTLPIAELGSSSLRARQLPGLLRGEVVGALAHAEPEGVRAVECADGWRLEGVQPRVVNAPIADVFVVRAGAAMFVVERGTAGLQVGARLETTGLRTAMVGELRLLDCEVPAEHRLGPAGGTGRHDEPSILEWMRHRQRACLLAPWVGLLGALVLQCEAAARERGASQPQRASLVDLRIRAALCERVVTRAAWRLVVGGEALEQDLAVAGALLGDATMSMTQAAMRDFAEPLGCAGLVERLARDASTLARLIEAREAPRRTIAAALLELA